MRRATHWLTIGLIGWLLYGCDEEQSTLACRVNSDCPIPQVCFGADEANSISGRCILECRLDSDCDSDHLCVDHVCRGPDGNCRETEDCTAFGRVCHPGTRTCVVPCGLDEICPGGGRCLDGRCLPGSQSSRQDMGDGQNGTPRDARTAPPTPRRDAGAGTRQDARVQMDAGSPSRDVAVDPPPMDMNVVRGPGQHGDMCRCGADCMSGLCLPNPYNQFAGQCTSECGGGIGCPGVERCILVNVPEPSNNCPPAGLNHQVGDQIGVCAVNETGVPCNGPQDCLIDGTCILPPNPIPGQVDVQRMCGALCQGDAQCPHGFSCGPIDLGGGRIVNACGVSAQLHSCPDGSNGTCGGVCNVGPGVDPLDVSHCIVLAPNQPGYCSCSCNSAAQCPAGFACSRDIIDTQDPRRPGICLPIGGYTCPTGGDSCLTLACAPALQAELFPRCTAPCNTPNDCPTGYQCIEIPGEDGSYCIAQAPRN